MFKENCKYLAGTICLDPVLRICSYYDKCIKECGDCKEFKNDSIPCEICEIQGYCSKLTKNRVLSSRDKDKELPSNMSLSPLTNPKRNMLYHIWPNVDKNQKCWQWNVDWLKHYIKIFDGVRSVGIVTGNGTSSAQEVKDYFGDVRIDNWIELANNPTLREGVTFVSLMETLPRDNGITWYGHAKGVRHLDLIRNVPMTWAYVMYALTLGRWEECLEILQTKPIVGNFRRCNDFHLPKHFVWHYSGTFFWFRNDEVFKREGWDDIARHFFACIEAWPSRIFHPTEAGVQFGDDAGDLYDIQTWGMYTQPLKKLGIEIFGA